LEVGIKIIHQDRIIKMEKVSSLYLANIIIEDNLKTEKDQAMAR
jgi:hypothetical protein